MGSLVEFSLSDIGSVFKDVREAWTGEAIVDPAQKAEMLYKMKVLEQQALAGQIAINQVEAGSKNWFVSSWRPFIGWVGGMAIAFEFIGSPMIQWIAKLNGIEVIPPTLDSAMLMNLIVAMLGIGGMRTWEKTKGVQNKVAE